MRERGDEVCNGAGPTKGVEANATSTPEVSAKTLALCLKMPF